MRAWGSVSPTVVFFFFSVRKEDRQASRWLNHWRSPCPPVTRRERERQEIKNGKDPGVWESKNAERGRSGLALDRTEEHQWFPMHRHESNSG